MESAKGYIRLTQDTTAPIVLLCSSVCFVCVICIEKYAPNGQRKLGLWWCLLFCEGREECGRRLVMDVVKPRNSRSTYICTIDVTDRRRMISHTIFFFPNLEKQEIFSSRPATKASDAMDAIHQFQVCSIFGNNLQGSGLTLTSCARRTMQLLRLYTQCGS